MLGGIIVVLAISFAVVWFFSGYKYFFATPGVRSSFAQSKAIYEEDLAAIQKARDDENRVASLVAKTGNRKTVEDLLTEVSENQTKVLQNNTNLVVNTIAFEEMTVPFSWIMAKRHMLSGVNELIAWKEDSKKYFELASPYYNIVSDVAEYKDSVANQNFDKQNNNDAIASHTKLKALCDEILAQTKILSTVSGKDFENLTKYFTKASAYHDKNIAFYQADQRRDTATQKDLSNDVTSLKNELAKMNPLTDLEDLQASHLAPLRDTLKDEESRITSDYNIFKDKN